MKDSESVQNSEQSSQNPDKSEKISPNSEESHKDTGYTGEEIPEDCFKCFKCEKLEAKTRMHFWKRRGLPRVAICKECKEGFNQNSEQPEPDLQIEIIPEGSLTLEQIFEKTKSGIIIEQTYFDATNKLNVTVVTFYTCVGGLSEQCQILVEDNGLCIWNIDSWELVNRPASEFLKNSEPALYNHYFANNEPEGEPEPDDDEPLFEKEDLFPDEDIVELLDDEELEAVEVDTRVLGERFEEEDFTTKDTKELEGEDKHRDSETSEEETFFCDSCEVEFPISKVHYMKRIDGAIRDYCDECAKNSEYLEEIHVDENGDEVVDPYDGKKLKSKTVTVENVNPEDSKKAIKELVDLLHAPDDNDDDVVWRWEYDEIDETVQLEEVKGNRVGICPQHKIALPVKTKKQVIDLLSDAGVPENKHDSLWEEIKEINEDYVDTKEHEGKLVVGILTNGLKAYKGKFAREAQVFVKRGTSGFETGYCFEDCGKITDTWFDLKETLKTLYDLDDETLSKLREAIHFGFVGNLEHFESGKNYDSWQQKVANELREKAIGIVEQKQVNDLYKKPAANQDAKKFRLAALDGLMNLKAEKIEIGEITVVVKGEEKISHRDAETTEKNSIFPAYLTLSNKCEKLEAENAELKEINKSYKEDNEKLAKLEAPFDELSDLKAENAKLKEKNEQWRETHNINTSIIQQNNTEKANLEAENTKLKAELEELKKSFDNLEKLPTYIKGNAVRYVSRHENGIRKYGIRVIFKNEDIFEFWSDLEGKCERNYEKFKSIKEKQENEKIYYKRAKPVFCPYKSNENGDGVKVGSTSCQQCISNNGMNPSYVLCDYKSTRLDTEDSEEKVERCADCGEIIAEGKGYYRSPKPGQEDPDRVCARCAGYEPPI